MNCAGRWIRISCCLVSAKVSFNGQWVGMEALARWQHPEYGLISPARFIPLAEHNGLIDPLTEVIIGKALRDGHLWEKTGLSLNLSMNLSTTSLIEGICATPCLATASAGASTPSSSPSK